MELFCRRLEDSTEVISAAMLALIGLQCDVKLDRMEEANKQWLCPANGRLPSRTLHDRVICGEF